MGRILCAVAAAVGIGGPAHATFGDKGQVVPGGSVNFDASFSVPGDSGPSGYSVNVFPSLVYFVGNRWALGGTVGIGYASLGDAHILDASLGPTAGYAIPVSERMSFFPEVTVFASRISRTTQIIFPGGPSSTTDESFWTLSMSLFTPVLFHPVEHVSLGFGPVVTANLATTSTVAQRVAVGFSSTIGVYF